LKGVTGIVEEPIKGAASQGMEGFIKGLGRGLIGAAVKPTVGAIDLATQTTKGIRNTATMWEASAERRRPPRVFDQDKTLEPYSMLQAEGSELMRKMSKGKHKHEEYLYHAYLGQPDRIVLVTNEHIFLRNRLDLHKVWTEHLISTSLPM
jgi:vacuolar protein sorting-associated protein 13A/C